MKCPYCKIKLPKYIKHDFKSCKQKLIQKSYYDGYSISEDDIGCKVIGEETLSLRKDGILNLSQNVQSIQYKILYLGLSQCLFFFEERDPLFLTHFKSGDIVCGHFDVKDNILRHPVLILSEGEQVNDNVIKIVNNILNNRTLSNCVICKQKKILGFYKLFFSVHKPAEDPLKQEDPRGKIKLW
ncbi:hypothetical protein EDC55_11420 [Allofrancisella inopinata]|uniref:Uncharacterized protein n=1 Tax=Allofrancisella inopinata TaxID=1085647 RepID=A0AAE6YGD6_9GAMM|nr:hypothetical protein [Allofrancisella inopinata]QIV95383.1 hypothetical protein E4K63_00435 [Allofrancisella inopinata]TDT70400.1 hypothetical protein EDC55_11420 [Allofrancisella inopinata]